MKVDNARVNLSPPVQPVAGDAAKSSAKSAGSNGSDAVSLSASLRLADQAVRAAAVSARVRPEAVAKGRALLAAGSLGMNADRLAERIINHLTQSSDDDHS